MSITAIIPVREGSRRLKNKNIAPFAGTYLLINKINQLKIQVNALLSSSTFFGIKILSFRRGCSAYM